MPKRRTGKDILKICLVFFSGIFTAMVYMDYLYEMKMRKVPQNGNVLPLANAIIKKPAHSQATASQELNNLVPIDDFDKFPCFEGLATFPEDKWQVEGKCVRTFNNKASVILNTTLCVPLITLRGTTPICTYPAERDAYVSAGLQKHGRWERHMVNNLVTFILAQPDLVFLDLGCNIGTYTLSMAYVGIKVIAVDPVIENLNLLSGSVIRGNLQENIFLIWNAISNKRTLITLNIPNRNVGATRIKETNLSESTNTDRYLVRTITLDDLIPLYRGKRVVIKMDIEGSEFDALMGGQTFLDEIDVVLIQIEWYFYRPGKHGMELIELLRSRKFNPYGDLNRKKPLESVHVSTWPYNIYFLKDYQ